jgi:hypothetical protein
MTSLRQLVESKGKVQSIHKCGSDNPLSSFSKSTKALHEKHFSERYYPERFAAFKDFI